MDNVYKEKWVNALRSDQYTQGRVALCRENPDNETEFCCLGVLLDVYDPGGWDKPDEERNIRNYYGACGTVPPEIADKLCISLHHLRTLICMNDDNGMTFGDIANFIEENM